MSREEFYTNQQIEAILGMVYRKPNDKKNRRLLDILPTNVINNTLRRSPKDTMTWTTEGVLHTRARETYSAPQV